MGSFSLSGGTFTTTVKGTPTSAYGQWVMLTVKFGWNEVRVRGDVVPAPDGKTSRVTFDLSNALARARGRANLRARENKSGDDAGNYYISVMGRGIYSPISGASGSYTLDSGTWSYSGASDGILPEGPVQEDGEGPSPEAPAAGATAYGASSPGDLLDPPSAPFSNPCLPPQPSPSSPGVATPCGGGSSGGVAGFSS